MKYFFGFKKKSLVFPYPSLFWLALLSMVFFIEWVTHYSFLIGNEPREWAGLIGIFFAPFFHVDFQHFLGNMGVLVVLLPLLYHTHYRISTFLLFQGTFFSGLLLWIFGGLWTHEAGIHLGASLWVYFIGFFLAFRGIFNRQTGLSAVSLFIILIYGQMIWGVVPQEWLPVSPTSYKISWEGHLYAAVVGIGLAWKYRHFGEKPKVYDWELPDYQNPYDEWLWQTYLAMEMEEADAESASQPQVEKRKGLNELL